MLEAADIPEIWETEEDKEFSIGQLKYHYLQIARQKFQGKVFTNKDTQNPIRACKVNGKLFRIIITVRKGVDDIAKFRYYTLKNVKFLPVQ